MINGTSSAHCTLDILFKDKVSMQVVQLVQASLPCHGLAAPEAIKLQVHHVSAKICLERRAAEQVASHCLGMMTQQQALHPERFAP